MGAGQHVLVERAGTKRFLGHSHLCAFRLFYSSQVLPIGPEHGRWQAEFWPIDAIPAPFALLDASHLLAARVEETSVPAIGSYGRNVGKHGARVERILSCIR
jgi:hypothetical protein